MKKTLLSALLFALLSAAVTADDGEPVAQSVFHVENFGFFDNREVHSPYQFSGTYFGTRLGADWGFLLGNSSVAAGGYVIKDFGQQGLTASDWTLYYRYQGGRFSGAFGSFPRSLLFRELPDVFVDEVIRYYTPNLGGALFQMKTYKYGVPNGYVELYCDWLSRQSITEREIFEIVSDGEWQFDQFTDDLFKVPKRNWSAGATTSTGGVEHGIGALGYNARLTHFSVRKGVTPDRVYDKLMLNPYATIRYPFFLFRDESNGIFTLSAGPMASFNRDRTDHVWKMPIGLLYDASCYFPFFRTGANMELRHRAYMGKPLMSDYDLYGTQLHRGDPYYRSSEYQRLDASFILVHSNDSHPATRSRSSYYVDCRVTASFHLLKDHIDYSQQIHVRLLF